MEKTNPEKLIHQKRFFYFITPLGLERVVQLEIEEKLLLIKADYKIHEISPGGIELSATVADILQLIPYFRGVTRILMRLGNEASLNLYKTTVRDLPKLFQKVSKFHWNDYLNGDVPEYVISAKSSRLFDSRKIEKSFSDGILRHFQMRPPKAIYLKRKDQLPKTTLYVRFQDDMMTVSLDLCGERLDRRKEKLMTTEAPIRESIAHNMLRILGKHLETNKSYRLLDPFLGSGTILKEAIHFDDWLSVRANEHRFPFETFPILEKDYIDYQKTEIFNERQILLGNKKSLALTHFLGFDIDELALKAAGLNLEGEIKTGIKIQLKKQDLFELKTLEDNTFPTIVVTNPPYGERLLKDIPNDFLKQTIEKIEQLGCEILVLVSLKEQTKKISKNVVERISFSNGGLDVECIVIKK